MSKLSFGICIVAVAAILSGSPGCQRESTRGEPAKSEPRTDSAAPQEQASNPLDEAILRLLGDLEEDPDDQGAQDALVALGEAVVPHLEEALPSEDADLRMGLVEILREIPGDAAFAMLLRALGDKDEDVRFAVAEALGAKGDPRAVPDLLRRYQVEKVGQVRYEILTALGPIGDPSTIPLLLKESKDEDRYVRMWSADALCRMGAPDSVDVATRLLGDPDKYVRRHILAACAGALTRDDSRAGILHIAINADDFEEAVLARRNLQKALAGPGGPELRRRVESEAVAALEGDKAIHAALVLADINNVAGLEKLRDGVGDRDPFVRHHIAFELGRLGGPSSVVPLVGLLSDQNELVAATAYDALLNFAENGNAEAIEATQAYKGKKFPLRLKDLQQQG